jgi:hypothetical protein
LKPEIIRISLMIIKENPHSSFGTSKSKKYCTGNSSYVVIEWMAALEIHG